MWVEQPSEQPMPISINIRSGIHGFFILLTSSNISFFPSWNPCNGQPCLVIVKKEWNIGAIMNNVLSLIGEPLISSQILQTFMVQSESGRSFYIFYKTNDFRWFTVGYKKNLTKPIFCFYQTGHKIQRTEAGAQITISDSYKMNQSNVLCSHCITV